jgi:hypothetical protein
MDLRMLKHDKTVLQTGTSYAPVVEEPVILVLVPP